MEFGSDFHQIDNQFSGNGMPLPENCNLYASGRQALEDLVISQGFKRVWIPSYYCYESLARLEKLTEVSFYDCNPLIEPEEALKNIPFKPGDILLRMNYFGLWNFRSSNSYSVPIVEDHSHDLFGPWVSKSNADWCFASLRKTLPIADGGILWSPQKQSLPMKPLISEVTEKIERFRTKAMVMKRDYLLGVIREKDTFLHFFRETEEEFDILPISRISTESFSTIKNIDFDLWMKRKRNNHRLLRNYLNDIDKIKLLTAESEECFPFSLVVILRDNETRNEVRRKLINSSVYPAILWPIPDNGFLSSKEFGDRMLSIHCDGRYPEKDMHALAEIIRKSL